MTRPEWKAQLARIVATWNKTVPEATEAAWFVELQEFDPADVAEAVTKLIRSSDRAPSVAKLRDASREARTERLRNEPVLDYDPDGVPMGALALIRSENYQDIAVVERGALAPWDTRVTEALGDRTAWRVGPRPTLEFKAATRPVVAAGAAEEG